MPVQSVPEAPAPQAAQSGAARLPGESDEAYKARIHQQAEHDVKAEEAQRILEIIPGSNVVLSGRAVPLSAGQKTQLAVHAAIDPFNVVGAFVLAGASEITDSETGYHWGPAGYFKRAGANLADVVDGTLLSGAVYPILLHQDPRYFRQGTGSFRSRMRHALLGAVICRGDNGRSQFNYSNVLGNLSAGGLSNLYYPSNQRGPGLAFTNGGTVIAEGSAGNLALEFGPDLSAWWQQRRASTKFLHGNSAPARQTAP